MNIITISATEARKNLFKLLDKLNNPTVQITIIRRGKPQAVLVNAEEFDVHQETLEILADKKIVKQIQKAENDFENGKYNTFKDVFGKTTEQTLSKSK